MGKSELVRRLTDYAINYPQKVVVYDSERSWTWQELMEEAHAYAESIRQFALGEEIIPIIVDRSGRSVAAMIGCLLAGKCFANISHELPILRIEHCIHKTKSALCIDVSGLYTQQLSQFCNVLSKQESTTNQWHDCEIVLNRLLYILFTSGSSGDPKAVKVTTSNIENTMMWSLDMIDWRPTDIMGCASQFSFDISMFDFFTLLYFNVPLVIFSNVKDYRVVLDEIKQFKVTSIFSVPQFFSSLLVSDVLVLKEKCNSLRRILSGGDFFNPNHLLQWVTEFKNIDIYNVWGPTETSIVNTMHRLNDDDFILLKEGKIPSIGTHHNRMPFVLLNESRTEKIVKPYEQGEIVMLGECVTDGYLNDQELTDSKYSTYHGARCFYTEDLAYMDENNKLFIVGRMGTMVKISGYRVDLNEIEFVARGYNNIDQCCCIVVMNDLKEKQLQIICTRKDMSIDFSLYAFKLYLRERLPQYMVPKKVHIINEMPLNANQKIDRKQLTVRYTTL